MAYPTRAVTGQAVVKTIRRYSRGYVDNPYEDRQVRYDLECGHSVVLLRKQLGRRSPVWQPDPKAMGCPVCGPV